MIYIKPRRGNGTTLRIAKACVTGTAKASKTTMRITKKVVTK